MINSKHAKQSHNSFAFKNRVTFYKNIYFIKIFILTCSEFKIPKYFKYSSILIFKLIKLGSYNPYKQNRI